MDHPELFRLIQKNRAVGYFETDSQRALIKMKEQRTDLYPDISQDGIFQLQRSVTRLERHKMGRYAVALLTARKC